MPDMKTKGKTIGEQEQEHSYAAEAMLPGYPNIGACFADPDEVADYIDGCLYAIGHPAAGNGPDVAILPPGAVSFQLGNTVNIRSGAAEITVLHELAHWLRDIAPANSIVDTEPPHGALWREQYVELVTTILGATWANTLRRKFEDLDRVGQLC